MEIVFYDHWSPGFRSFVSKIANIKIPKPIEEALMIPKWKKAIKEEMEALVKNET